MTEMGAAVSEVHDGRGLEARRRCSFALFRSPSDARLVGSFSCVEDSVPRKNSCVGSRNWGIFVVQVSLAALERQCPRQLARG